jgi:alkylation response protein AidB-like acyl-CoA dehydrogenase
MESNDIVDETNSLDSADTEVSIHWVYGTQLVARLADGRELLIDQPKQYGGLDSAPNPPEYLLCAAGAELTARLLAQARRSDWQLPKFSIVSEGSVHLCGITNLDENAPVRMYDLTQRVEFEKASDPSEFVAIVRAAARQTHAHAIVRRPLEIQATVTHRSEKLSEFTTNLQMLREYMSELAARKQRGR